MAGSASRSKNWVMSFALAITSAHFLFSGVNLEVSAPLTVAMFERVDRSVGILAVGGADVGQQVLRGLVVAALLGEHEAVDRRLDRILAFHR